MRNATEEIERGMRSKNTDKEKRHTSGISEMDAIVGRVVLGFGSLKP